MIADTIAGSGRYLALHRGFAAAFEFLRRADLADLAPGRYEIDGERVFALIEHPAGRGTAGARLEIHRRHIDIQVSLDGREQIGWRALADCQSIDSPYSEERDIAFFSDRPTAWLPLPQGQFMVFFPDDAHAPLAAEGPLHKVVVKLLVE
jgi:YhcH/YjgK/YiaL family protein